MIGRLASVALAGHQRTVDLVLLMLVGTLCYVCARRLGR